MKLLNLLFIFDILVLSVSCEKSEPGKSDEAKLLKVTCAFGNGVIDTATNTVIIKALESTDISKIISQFEISKNVTIYPPSGVAINFSNPVLYTITSEDNTTINIFTVIVLKPIVKFTVYDCSGWTPENFRVPQADAVIKIYIRAEDVGTTKTYDVLTANQNAKAILFGLRTNNYYFTVEKDNKSNLINGFVLLGTYNSQEEVDTSPDPDAMIGGLRFMDVNRDGKINSNDKFNCGIIWSEYDLSGNDILLKDLYIANKN